MMKSYKLVTCLLSIAYQFLCKFRIKRRQQWGRQWLKASYNLNRGVVDRTLVKWAYYLLNCVCMINIYFNNARWKLISRLF